MTYRKRIESAYPDGQVPWDVAEAICVYHNIPFFVAYDHMGTNIRSIRQLFNWLASQRS